MRYVKLKDENGVRDMKSNAVLFPKNKSDQARKRRKYLSNLENENKDLKNRINKLEQLVKQILEKE